MLTKMVNKAVDCKNFNFFDVIDDITFEYLFFDTTDYVAVPPDTKFSVASDGTVTITIPAIEQQKLPVFRDISLLAAIKYRNSNFPGITNDFVFQNIIITIKFEPKDSKLVANMIASDSNVIRGETLILDASSSYISNMPSNMKTRGIAFEW